MLMFLTLGFFETNLLIFGTLEINFKLPESNTGNYNIRAVYYHRNLVFTNTYSFNGLKTEFIAFQCKL